MKHQTIAWSITCTSQTPLSTQPHVILKPDYTSDEDLRALKTGYYI
ncbi:MAG: hypothetical protein NWE98_12335 [Candidatus Bathyarchaeota archaeon]|nr:hypothetical protein [Candidatus Bathyarchaeota archaeon]